MHTCSVPNGVLDSSVGHESAGGELFERSSTVTLKKQNDKYEKLFMIIIQAFAADSISDGVL